MVKSLFDLSLAVVCQHRIRDDLGYMPSEFKQRLLDYLTSHDQLSLRNSDNLVNSPLFGMNLTSINFYLSKEITDQMLIALTRYNKFLESITLISCENVTDEGVLGVTKSQFGLKVLELRLMHQITDFGLSEIKSPYLNLLDLSGCIKLTSEGLRWILSWNRSICALYLNSCVSLDEQALYHIAYYTSDNLRILELNFLKGMTESAMALQHLSQACPNLHQLSLANFFQYEEMLDYNPYRIDGFALQNVDLHANFFITLPQLPPTLTHLRLSVSGDEDVVELIKSLEDQPFLRSITLGLNCMEESLQAIDNANNLLCNIIPFLGDRITSLQIAVARLFDPALSLITEYCSNLTHLSLNVKHMSNYILQKYFSGGHKSAGSKLRSIRIANLKLGYRVLFAIARGARSLVEFEATSMISVDDRILSLLADNCHQLSVVNVNDCKYVTDKGVARIAKRCPLREIRIRGTACTDRSIITLAQFCPNLEWISHKDQTGRPNITNEALQKLKDSCVSRVIC